MSDDRSSGADDDVTWVFGGPEDGGDAPSGAGSGSPAGEGGGSGGAAPGSAGTPFDGGVDLRPGADDCYKCSACDTDCPVAEVDDDFPGPKFQGPEQWRLKRREDRDVDPSIEACSNCMRCDAACPADVPLSEMHNRARAEHVENRGLSRKAIRDRILANYGTTARVASTVPRLANLVMGNRLTAWLNEKLLGITAEREFPEFATTTFREWFEARGGPAVESADRRVAYFHGDYANFNTPEVGKALVRVYEHFGYEVRVPEQRCSGTPMFANGHLDDARRAAEVNVDRLSALVEDGYDVVCSCTSCSMALRQEYPELFSMEGTASVAASTYEAVEYLRIHEDLPGALADADADPAAVPGVDPETDGAHPETDGAASDGDAGPDDAASDGDPSPEAARFVYHAPCHARNQGIAGQPVELFRALDGVDVEDVGDSCSGISGTYGWKEERYEASMAIGEEMFEEMHAADGEVGMTECPTCAMQMEHGTGYDVRHPLEVLEAALVE